MTILVECIKMFIDVSAMLCVVLIIEVLFGAKIKINSKKLLIASALMLLLEFLLERVFLINAINQYIVTFLEFLFMFIAAFTFATEKRFRTAFLTIPAVLVYLDWGMIIDLMERMLGFGKYPAIDRMGNITVGTVIADATLLILLILIKCKASKVYQSPLSIGELTLISVFCFFSPVINIVLESLESVVDFNGYKISWMVFVLVLNIAVVYGISYRKKAKYYKQQSETYKNQFDDEYSYFKEYKNNNKEIAKFRHDWNNHMIVMQQLFEQGKFEEAKKYFESFPAVKKSNSSKVLSGNETVDTIFAAKSEFFTRYEIDLKLNGNLSRLSSMEPMDICILFSNLIDNAIDALYKVTDKRYLHVTVTDSPNMLMIIFKNPTAHELLKEGNIIKSTKVNATQHGIGLQNVADIVKKYKGEYYIETPENEFVIKLVLPM